MYYILLTSLINFSYVFAQNCNIQNTEYGTVCVCTAEYCDGVPELEISHGKYQVYSTSKSKLGFYSNTDSFTTEMGEEDYTIFVNESTKYQSIIGFGGAFTDATGINIRSLPKEAQGQLMESYFGKSGIEYSLCRVPIGATDFSTRKYSYDDVENDTTLQYFSLQYEDFQYKIPLILEASVLKGGAIRLFASAWSAPIWTKTNHDWSGIGRLKREYYQYWADYHLKFLQEYEKYNISFWGITTQNEPADGLLPKFIIDIMDMGWLPWQMTEWVGNHLGPTIRNSKYNNLKIILHDDTTLSIPFFLMIKSNKKTMSYADGAATHWYSDGLTPDFSLDFLKSDKKNWFFFSSEACNGNQAAYFGKQFAINKGSWKRGENYVKDILKILEYGGSGWIDWNMVLNETGGPTYVNNIVDSPILVNKTLKQFYKQPMFYALGHFSKFVKPESVRIKTTIGNKLKNVRAIAFLRPDNLKNVFVHNSDDKNITIHIQSNTRHHTARIEIEANSFNTILYS